MKPRTFWPPGRPTASSSRSANAAGNRVVQFGNGVQGARTPTGTSNIRATYRKGIGSAGMVSAGQLTQPLDRPQGLSSVTNPGAASGAADPASAGQARASAPLPTLTIGRVVSLEDYQNYALAFAGISKALATWTWFGNVRGVFLTVAGANGATLSSDDPVVTALIGAIRLCGDPHVPLLVTSYVPVLFTFTAGVAVDQADYDPDQVLAQVWQNVSAAFAFGQRQLGQNVAASDIIEIIQQTAGVIAVRLQALGRSGSGGRRAGARAAVRQRPCPAAGRPDAPARSRDPGQHWTLVMSLDADQLFALLPAVYRTRDAANGGQLQALFAVMAAQSGIVEDNIQQLYDDQFIETCAPWVIPYIGDLIGYNSIYEVASASSDSRAEVANTIGYRRRKGTLLALEQLSMDVSGRAAVVVEEFRRLITTESMRHVRPRHDATVNLRGGRALDRLGTAFDVSSRTIDVRRIAPRVRDSPGPRHRAARHRAARPRPLQHSRHRHPSVALAELAGDRRARVRRRRRPVHVQPARQRHAALLPAPGRAAPSAA